MESLIIVKKNLDLSYPDYRSGLTGFLNSDPLFCQTGQLSYASLSLFRMMEFLSQRNVSLEELKKIVINWAEYKKRFTLSGDHNCQLFTPVFLALFLYYRNFPLLFSTFSELSEVFDSSIDEESIRSFYSICSASLKTRNLSGDFDIEAFLFFLLNNESANSELFPGKSSVLSEIPLITGSGLQKPGLTTAETVALSLIRNSQGSRNLPETGTDAAYWTGFVTGIFQKQHFIHRFEPELEEFVCETIDNFWCLINGEPRNALSV